MPLTHEQEQRLADMLDAIAHERGRLNDWEQKFFDDHVARYEQYKSAMSLSPKQWARLEEMYEKITR